MGHRNTVGMDWKFSCILFQKIFFCYFYRTIRIIIMQTNDEIIKILLRIGSLIAAAR